MLAFMDSLAATLLLLFVTGLCVGLIIAGLFSAAGMRRLRRDLLDTRIDALQAARRITETNLDLLSARLDHHERKGTGRLASPAPPGSIQIIDDPDEMPPMVGDMFTGRRVAQKDSDRAEEMAASLRRAAARA